MDPVVWCQDPVVWCQDPVGQNPVVRCQYPVGQNPVDPVVWYQDPVGPDPVDPVGQNPVVRNQDPVVWCQDPVVRYQDPVVPGPCAATMGASGSKTIPTLTLTGFEGRMATFFFTCSCTNSKGELMIMVCFILHNIAEQRAEPLPEADDRYMAMLAAYNAMFEGIELLGADEDGMGDNGGAAAAGGHLVPFGALEHGFAVPPPSPADPSGWSWGLVAGAVEAEARAWVAGPAGACVAPRCVVGHPQSQLDNRCLSCKYTSLSQAPLLEKAHLLQRQRRGLNPLADPPCWAV
ncbi:hypothetical protein V8C86DRAFT_2441709 [Haematococcus lacustris]